MSKRFLDTPETPPRSRGHDIYDATPVNLFKGMLQTPVTNTKKPYNFEHKRQRSVEQNLLSPEFTPAKTPPKLSRSFRKYKDSIFELSLPTRIKPSKKLTIGSGRKFGGALPSLKHSLLEELNGSGYDLFKEIDVSGEKPPQPIETPFEELQNPSTPSRKLITEDLAKEWYDKPRQQGFSDDEDDYGFPTEQKNPFISDNQSDNPFNSHTSTPSVFNPFAGPKIDYSTHIELVDKKGNKIIRELNALERSIKPKKLNFDDLVSGLPQLSGSLTAHPLLLTPLPGNLPLPPTSHKFSGSPGRVHKTVNAGEMSSKYVLKNLNNVMNMKSKNELEFEIYKDDEK